MAENHDIIDELDTLALHCRPPVMSADEKSRWLASWVDDLREFDIVAIRAACRNWRQGEGNTKFPVPGQLLPMVRACTPRPTPSGDPFRPWTWPDDIELGSMTLEEKIRQYRIMAHETRTRAGPMGDDGKVPRPQFISEAQGYLDKAMDLKGALARAKIKRAA